MLFFTQVALPELTAAVRRFSEAEAREVMYALVDGVAYLHSRNIVHRDLKPENVCQTAFDPPCPALLTLCASQQVLYRTPPGSHPEVGHDDCVISDFGLAAYVEPNGGRLHTVAGSAGYTAPEVYPEEGVVNGRGQGKGYGLKADVWSLGIIGARSSVHRLLHLTLTCSLV